MHVRPPMSSVATQFTGPVVVGRQEVKRPPRKRGAKTVPMPAPVPAAEAQGAATAPTAVAAPTPMDEEELEASDDAPPPPEVGADKKPPVSQWRPYALVALDVHSWWWVQLNGTDEVGLYCNVPKKTLRMRPGSTLVKCEAGWRERSLWWPASERTAHAWMAGRVPK